MGGTSRRLLRWPPPSGSCPDPRMVKLPLPPDLTRLREHEPAITGFREVLWRIHRRDGVHSIGWDELRHYGPLGSRFDPQPPGPAAASDEGVAYAAINVPTALAEVFQDTRVINVTRGEPWLAGWEPARELALLDLTGTWPIRIGASHAINTGRRDHARAWARALRAAWPQADGLLHTSAMTGQRCATMFNPAGDSFPPQPGFHQSLSDPRLAVSLLSSGASIGYEIV